MKYIILLLLFGCCELSIWENSLETHSCSKEQYELVVNASNVCQLNSDYSKRYCFGTAVINNCTKKK